MNVVVLMGRLTKDPDVRYSQDGKAIARYSLAVDRFKKGEADFLNCVAFGKNAEFTEKYFHRGMRVTVSGHLQTGSYTNREGQKVNTVEVIIDRQEFADGKGESKPDGAYAPTDIDGFMQIPSGIEEELPFN